MRTLSTAIFLLMCLVCLPGAALAENGFVEGTVFSKKTGVPLQNAVVFLNAVNPVICNAIGAPCSDVSVRLIGKRAITDGNGFYSIEVSESVIEELATGLLGRVVAIATCSKKDRARSSDPNAHRFELMPGVVEIRNLYVDVGIRRAFDSCDPPVLDFDPLPL